MKKQMEVGKKALEAELEVEIPSDGYKVTSKVKLKAPKQKDNKTVYYSVGEPPLDVKNLPDPEEFKPGRFIVNIILDKNASTDVLDPLISPDVDPDASPTIDPGVDIKVEITDADLKRAPGEMFSLAYHNGTKWVVKLTNIDNKTGFVSFKLGKIGDPAIAVKP